MDIWIVKVDRKMVEVDRWMVDVERWIFEVDRWMARNSLTINISILAQNRYING
jgi:hypothetical protein